MADGEKSMLNGQDDDDLFTSAVQEQPKEEDESSNILFGGEEVNLNDEEEEEPVESSPDTVKEPLNESDKTTEDIAPAALTSVDNTQENISTNITSSKDEDEQNEDEARDEFIEIKVKDPQKIGDGMSAYMAYNIVTKTNLKYFKKKDMSVMRRFSDFLGLHEKLAEKHLHLGRIVPPAPEKSVIGMTKIKMSKNEEGNTASSSDFVERRRAALERYLNRTAAHPNLIADPDFKEFMELESELPRATNTSALSGAGVMRLFSKMGDTVSKITFKMDENNPWFEEKQQQIESLDLQLRKLHSSVDCLVLHRKDLVGSTSTFAKSVAMLSNCEEHTALSRALSQLAEVEEKVEQLYENQVETDFFVLSELIKDYISLIGVIKSVFHQRVKIYQTWQHAQKMLTNKREQKAKLELAGKTDKVPQAREEVVDWEAKVERSQEEFENVSKMIRKEVERFEMIRVKDFKNTIIKYMEKLLYTQQQLVKYWETFLPEAKAIA